ncbi:MAG: PKD domain-containing protein, partial [Thermoplasmata archaeon]|nr:PKD domain-containing protein [Thermoplasmata archaeon]
NGSMGFVLTVYDPEGDALFAVWEFGDGSPSVYSVITEFTPNNTATVSINHTYTVLGMFTLVVTVTDNMTGIGTHSIITSMTIDVRVPREATDWIWDWWDYTSLALFCMIPITPILWALYTRRKGKLLERHGISLEEWKIRKDELGEVLKGKKE